MDRAVQDDPVLRRFRAAVDAAYGDRVERVVLYGSRARGDAGPESDYDVAVFLKDVARDAEDLFRLADLGTEILYETGQSVHAMPFAAGSLSERTPLMHEIRLDGVEI